MLVKTPVQLLSNETRDGHGPCPACCSVIYLWRWSLGVWMFAEVFCTPGQSKVHGGDREQMD